MESITIEDAGPIRKLTIPVQPGIIVFRAPNDTGKSQALEAVSKLVGGSANLTKRDGTAAGSIQGLGITVNLRQSMRRTGELEAVSLEGKPSILDLVSPPLKDPVAADRARIKALLQLTGAKADLALFTPLVPSGWNASDVFSVDTEKSDDLVEMASRAKRDFEALSRKQAEQAEKILAKAAACKAATEGIDLDIETDCATLQAKLEDAIYAQGTIEAKAAAAKKAKAAAADASERMAREPNAPDVLAAEVALEMAIRGYKDAQQRVSDVEDQLRLAQESLRAAIQKLNAAESALERVKAHASSLIGWQETIAAAESVECPSETAIAGAGFRVTQCRQDVEQAAVVRAAKERASEAKELAKAAAKHQEAAESLREAARSTDEVLSDAVNSDTMKVRAGRLITQHPTRGEVYLAERSVGTRWRLAMEEIIKRIRQTNPGATAIISVCQECWEGMDVANRAAIHDLAVELGVAVYTAESVGDELEAVPYEPANDYKRLYAGATA